MSDQVVIKRVITHPQAPAYNSGFGGVGEIVMRRDGSGPMGFYDVIHVYDDQGRAMFSMPAHQCAEWEHMEHHTGAPKA